jgi:hypothetical protein
LSRGEGSAQGTPIPGEPLRPRFFRFYRHDVLAYYRREQLFTTSERSIPKIHKRTGIASSRTHRPLAVIRRRKSRPNVAVVRAGASRTIPDRRQAEAVDRRPPWLPRLSPSCAATGEPRATTQPKALAPNSPAQLPEGTLSRRMEFRAVDRVGCGTNSFSIFVKRECDVALVGEGRLRDGREQLELEIEDFDSLRKRD